MSYAKEDLEARELHFDTCLARLAIAVERWRGRGESHPYGLTEAEQVTIHAVALIDARYALDAARQRDQDAREVEP